MSKINKLLTGILSLFSCSILLNGCSLFESGEISDYVGVYKCSVSYESHMEYYWGSDRELSSKNLCYVGGFLTIKEDKTIEFSVGNNQSISKGKIKVYEDYCRLIDVPGLDDSFKFQIKAINTNNLKGLCYYYRDRNSGFDYKYMIQNVVFQSYIDPLDYSNYVGEYKITDSTKVQHTKKYNDPSYNAYQGGDGSNYGELKGGKLIVNEDFTGKLISRYNDEYPLSISFSNGKITLRETSNPAAVLPQDLSIGFLSAEKAIYLYVTVNVDVPTSERYYTRYTYDFGFEKSIPSKHQWLK